MKFNDDFEELFEESGLDPLYRKLKALNRSIINNSKKLYLLYISKFPYLLWFLFKFLVFIFIIILIILLYKFRILSVYIHKDPNYRHWFLYTLIPWIPYLENVLTINKAFFFNVNNLQSYFSDLIVLVTQHFNLVTSLFYYLVDIWNYLYLFLYYLYFDIVIIYKAVYMCPFLILSFFSFFPQQDSVQILDAFYELYDIFILYLSNSEFTYLLDKSIIRFFFLEFLFNFNFFVLNEYIYFILVDFFNANNLDLSLINYYFEYLNLNFEFFDKCIYRYCSFEMILHSLLYRFNIFLWVLNLYFNYLDLYVYDFIVNFFLLRISIVVSFFIFFIFTLKRFWSLYLVNFFKYMYLQGSGFTSFHLFILYILFLVFSLIIGILLYLYIMYFISFIYILSMNFFFFLLLLFLVVLNILFIIKEN